MNILSLFQYHNKLKFSDIEKALKVRSNKLAYHLKNLTKKGILKKEEKFYSLSETSEYLVPYLSKKRTILPIVLIKIGGKKVFLIKRQKRPFKGQLSLPGGRILLGESFAQAIKRIMKEKFNINANLKHFHSITLENLKRKGKIIQTDLIIFVTATTKDKIDLLDIEKNKSKIITSDYLLIKNDSNKKADIKTINTTKI